MAGGARGEVTIRGAVVVALLGAVAAAAMIVYSGGGPGAILDGAEAGLKSSDWQSRKKVVEGLGEYVAQGNLAADEEAEKRARSLVVSTLADPNDEVRLAAVRECRKLEERSAVEPLAEIVSGKGPLDLRISAAKALQVIGDSKAAPELREVMESDSEPEKMRIAAIDALGTCGGVESVTAILRARVSGSDDISAHASLALSKIRSRNTVLRAYGLAGSVRTLDSQLGRMQKAIDDQQKALDQMLDETEGKGDRSGELSELYEKLDSEDANARLVAVYDLGVIGRKESVAELSKMLADKDEAVRKAAHGALVKIVGKDLGTESAPWQEWHRKNARK